MTRYLVLDVSRHQGIIDWPKAARRLMELGADVPRAAIRATVGDYYTDPMFPANWAGAKAAGFAVTAYHVVTPERGIDTQAHNFARTVGYRKPDFAPGFGWVLDCELTRGQTPALIGLVISSLAARLYHDNRPPAIYTRASWWDVNVPRSSAWRRYPLWVAHYGAQEPRLPADWSDWRLWQFSADGNGRGNEFGMQSASVDLSWYAGPVVPPPEPQPGIVLRVRPQYLTVRSGPGTQYPAVRHMPRGTAVQVRGLVVVGNDVWVDMGGGEYCALVYRGTAYLENGQ